MTLIKETCQVVVDIDVRFKEFDPEIARDNWQILLTRNRPFTIQLGVSEAEFVDHQETFFRAFCDNESSLNGWARAEASYAAVDWDLDAIGDLGRSDEMLVPLFPALPPPSRRFFETMLRGDRFLDAAHPFLMAWIVECTTLAIEEVGRPRMSDPSLVLNRSYQATIGTKVECKEINGEDAAVRIFGLNRIGKGDPVVLPQEYAAHSRNLMEALAKNQQILDEWCQDLALSHAGGWGAESLLGPSPNKDLMRPVVEGLSPDQRAYYEKVSEAELNYEAYSCFYDNWRATTVTAKVV